MAYVAIKPSARNPCYHERHKEESGICAKCRESGKNGVRMRLKG
jgi:hypothetical protein